MNSSDFAQTARFSWKWLVTWSTPSRFAPSSQSKRLQQKWFSLPRRQRRPTCCNLLNGGRRADKKSGQPKLPARGRKCRRSGKGYSNFSVRTGNCSLALASDFTTVASAFSAVVLREVAISLTSRYLARSSIFFSRKERGLLRLRETRLLRTTATSRRDPVRMRSEFSLKRRFQSRSEERRVGKECRSRWSPYH